MIVNRQGLADAMGVSLPTVDRWIAAGLPTKVRGRRGVQWEIVLGDAIAWWGNRERENATGGDTRDEKELRIRQLVANTGEAELRFAKAKAEVAMIDEFERAWARMFAAIQTNVMNVASRACLQLLGETDETTFKEKLREELQTALDQSATPDFDLEDDDEDMDMDMDDDE